MTHQCLVFEELQGPVLKMGGVCGDEEEMFQASIQDW